MVDWKKDVKLSDLFRRSKSDDAAPAEGEAPPAPAEDSAETPDVPENVEPTDAPKSKKRKAKAVGKSQRKQTRHKKLVGLKIGASQLAAARVINNGQPELVQVAQEPLAAGIVVGGELREPDALVEALKQFFKENKLPRQGVRLGIASNRIGVRTFDIAGIDDEKQLHNAIRFRAQETLPIPIEEAVLDYQLLGDTVDEEGNVTKRVLLVVAYRDLIDRYVAACRKAGIKLAGVDLEAFALLRALAESGEESATAAVVVANVGSDRSTLAVSNGSFCEFTRVIEWGGANLNVCIARALDIVPSEAEPIKRALTLLEPAEETEGMDLERAAKIRTAVQEELENFAREIVSSLQFYQGQPGSLGIAEIVLSGGTSELPGLDTELARLIGVTVRVGDPFEYVKVGKKVDADAESGSLAVAIGLGMET